MLEGVGIAVEEVDPEHTKDVLANAAHEGVPFDAIITDVADDPAPASARLDLARSLNPDENVRGIVVIDANTRTSLSKFHATGFDAFLVRPIRPRSLLTQLGMCIDGASSPIVSACTPHGKSKNSGGGKGWREARVLLVEDNDINALLATRMLERIGCSIGVAKDGHEAVEQMRSVLSGDEESYDLILMDLRLPRLDGLSATRKINEIYRKAGVSNSVPPIAALTANAFAEDKNNCFDAGMDDYLAKPFEQAALEALLQKWCGGQGRSVQSEKPSASKPSMTSKQHKRRLAKDAKNGFAA
jgi:CheY-like chemotaxis protein